MKFKTHKRLLSMALALAMVFSEPLSAAAAGAAKVPADAAEAAIYAADEATAPTKGEQPGKVTGLYWGKNNGEEENKYLYWNNIQNADYYQIKVVDQNGVEYANGIDSVKDQQTQQWVKIPYYYTAYGDCDDGYWVQNLLNSYFAIRYDATTKEWYENRDTNDKRLYMTYGNVYNISVRAVNSEAYALDEYGNYVNKYFDEKAYGEWSDPIPYTAPAITNPEILTGVKYDPKEQTITFNRGSINDYVEVEVKDSKGREYYSYAYYDSQLGPKYTYYNLSDNTIYLTNTYSMYVWELKADDSGYKYLTQTVVKNEKGDEEYVRAFKPGETYTIRLRAVNTKAGNNSNDYIKATTEWTAPITVTPTAKVYAAPQVTGNLKYTVSGSLGTLRWNPSKDASGYEIEISDGTYSYNRTYSAYDESTQKYVSLIGAISLSGTSISLRESQYYSYTKDAATGDVKQVEDAAGNAISAFSRGKTYTVRVRAYNYKTDEDRWDGSYTKRQYSDWTAAYSFTIPTGTPALTKVKGVKASSGSVSWMSEENANTTSGYTTYYQVEVKDAQGRMYGESAPVKNQLGTYDVSYYTTSGTSLWYSDDLYTYVLEDGVYRPLEHNATPEYVRAFEPGKTYTVRVRAYRNYPATDGTETTVRTYGDWSDAVTCTVDSEYVGGTPAAPAKVTGLVLKDEFDYDANASSPRLSWNSIENVARYEVKITDSKGNLFSYSPNYINYKYVDRYPTTSSNRAWISNYEGLRCYVKQDGYALDTLKDAAGKDIKTFQAGETYSISVRAVNAYSVWDVQENVWKAQDYYYGEWSDAVTYKAPAVVQTIKNFKFEKEKDNNYYFSYQADTSKSSIYYQIATDTNFNSASLVGGLSWRQWDSSNSTLLYINGNSLEAGKTYYVRAINYPWAAEDDIDELNDAQIAALQPVTASFTVKGEKAPKNITGLKLYKEYSGSFEFRFNTVLKSEDNDQYELQTNQNQATDNWYSWGQTTSLSKSNLNPGTTYVRVVAYVLRTNKTTGQSEKVYGTPSNVVAVTKNTATSQIGTLKLKSTRDGNFTFTYTGNVDKSQYVRYDFSDDAKFSDNGETYISKNNSGVDQVNKEFTISRWNLTVGTTYYVRARVYNPYGKSDAESYSKYSNVVKFKLEMPKVSAWCAAITKDSITLSMGYSNNDSVVTGYEIEKLNGKNYVALARTTDSYYTDKKLKANTTYTYRVRPYFFNKDTKGTTYGEWVTVTATTWGGALKLTAKATSATAIKLSWSKVVGAEGYDIYRYLGGSSTTEISGGRGNNFSQYQLIKSVGAGTASYTDTGLTKDASYSYKVEAYKKIGGKKVTIYETAGVDLGFALNIISRVQKTDGKMALTWNPVYSAKGYLVEKYDRVSGKWSTYKNIKKNKTSSITLPATKDNLGVSYRIRAYKGTEYTDAYNVTVYPVIAAPTAVKAKVGKDGSITVTWKAVKGADFYRVYRTTDSWKVYNKDTKSYSLSGLSLVPLYVKDATQASGYKQVTDTKEMKVTKLVDQKLTYTINGVTNTLYEGPKTGVTYYYYVVAYKYNDAVLYDDNYETDDDGYSYRSSGYSAPASAKIAVKAPGKATLASVKAASKKITINYKKVNGADGYEILRSDKKNGKYVAVGVVNSADTLSYVDKNSKTNVLKKKKTYFYKVKAFVYDDAGNKVYGKESAVKSVKAK